MTKKGLNTMISTVIIISVTCLCFAGCKKTPSKNTPTKAVNTSGNKIVKDLKGTTVRVLVPPLKPGKGADTYKDFGYEGQIMTARINEIQDKFNCKLEYVGDGTYFPAWNNFHTSIMMGEPNADIVNVGFEHVIQSFEKGGSYVILNDYTDILELDNPDVWDQQVTKDLFSIDGLTAAISPAKYGADLVNLGMVMFFNKSMLEREGLWDENNLYEMQKNKTWTWQKLDDIADQVTKDKNGDGTIDQYGLIYGPFTFAGLNASNSDGKNTGIISVNEKNQAVFLGRNKSQINTLSFMHDSGAKGKGWMTAPNFGQETKEGPEGYFADGKCAFFIDPGHGIRILKEKKMKETVGVVAIPIGPDCTTKDYYLSREAGQAWIMPSGLKNTEHIAYVMRDLCAPLFTKDEADVGTETMLSDYIGDESEIIDTYKMMGDPNRLSLTAQSPFIATWSSGIASYLGSLPLIIEDGMTGEALNKEWGDAVQKEGSSYWKTVMDGFDKIKVARANKTK